MPRLRPIAALLVLLAAAPAWSADSAASAAIGEDLRGYYQGERTSAWLIFGMGAAAAGTGGYLLTRDSDLARGAGWPLLGLGVLEAVGAIVYAFQVGAELDHYQALLAKDPAGYREAELAHLQGTRDRFVYYRLGELGLAVGGAGALLSGALAGSDTAKGLGAGLVAIGLPFFLIDTVNNHRANRYLGHLEGFQPALSVSAGPHGVGFTLAARF